MFLDGLEDGDRRALAGLVCPVNLSAGQALTMIGAPVGEVLFPIDGLMSEGPENGEEMLGGHQLDGGGHDLRMVISEPVNAHDVFCQRVRLGRKLT